MPNTRITKQKWKDHYSYAKKVYIIGIICAIALTSLLFSVTRYVPENKYAVHVEFVDAYVDTSKLEADLPMFLEKGQDFDPTLEEVVFYSISYTGEGNTENDYYGSQVYTVQVYAGDNDVFIQNQLLTDNMITEGYALPLENMPGFEEFAKEFPDAIVYKPEPDPDREEEDEEDEEAEEPAEPEVLHAYAIDVTALRGLAERGAYDMRGKYAILTVTGENAETSFRVLTDMYRYYYVAPAEAPAASPSEAAPADAEVEQ